MKEVESIYGYMILSDDSAYRLCDFEKLYGAVLLKDEEMAKQWYKEEYSRSCFAVSEVDPVKRKKSGFIVLIGYMRSAVIGKNKNSSIVMLENMYIRLVENCMDEESIYKLFVTAFRDFSNRIGEREIEDKLHNEIYDCTQYISANIRLDITLSDIAEHCGYNPSYLSRKFKQVCGVTLKHFILTEKLKAAAAMLRFSDKSTAEIAALFKFASQSHFQKEFKNYYKTTPLKYRKDNRSIQ